MSPLWWLLALTVAAGWVTDTNHPDRLSWLTLGGIVAGCLALVVWPHVVRWIARPPDSITTHRAMLDALKETR